ncbi:MAG: tRNA (adenosine(37)-N6)-dimethylallyltransferase MiaA [Clostridia bacterium]|nr:tRNA (adenosine(37)-N6)-dimethylallyltransferase MiaA [Clostridia bacterium]
MKPLVVVIVGPTASGKTRLSIELAKRFGGEIVSADSMQIYRRMDIGTAKPTEEERAGIPHHLMDFLDPTEEYALKQYLEDADRCVQGILSRGKLPILVGGTGLYVSSFMQNLTLSEEPVDEEYRALLEADYERLGGEEMLSRLSEIDPELASRLFPKDKKRIIRGLEVYHNTGITQTEQNRKAMETESPYEFLCFGLTADDRAFLYERIDRRVLEMMDGGLLEEVQSLDLQNCSRTARQAIGYRQFEDYFNGEGTLEDAVARIQKESRNYAKRQLTWFRRDKRIHWFSVDTVNFDNILNYCCECIAKHREM